MELETLDELHLPLSGNDELFSFLSRFLRSLPCPYPDVPLLVDSLTEKATYELQKEVTSLFVLELWIYFPQNGPNKPKVEELLSSLGHLSPTSLRNNQQQTLAMIKYHDLVTDYQYFFCNGAKELKLVELLTKKLTVVTSAYENTSVVHEIHLKVAIYYMLCGSDSRKGVILKYLQSKGVLSWLLDQVTEYAQLSLGNSLIPFSKYLSFTEYLQNSNYSFRAIIYRQRLSFLKNFYDCNINKLPRYYTSIKFDRIRALLDGETQIDIVDFIYELAMSNKLPQGTKIDQVRNIVHFGKEPAQYDALSMRTKIVCDAVNSL